ncbi:hypothetical protein GCM10010319_22720 [Streptomyces blastmyceticus]|uniref:Uncharacterized protein n=1 Tax=Streptomyces blastmyceticus TaxID=68180 RepID=A0ABP3GL06_9ACTN
MLHTPFYEELFDAVLRPGHRLTVKSEPDLTDPRDDRWITSRPGDPAYQDDRRGSGWWPAP